MSINNSDLNLWIENHWNVLFRGKHGVGKTATIIEAFEQHKLNWRYYSAATMDPWVDFIGIPKEKHNDDGTSHIALVQPQGLHEVEAFFMDELNRAPKKVRNAVMELIQFRSINGVPFPNLKFVWAAINPDDEEAADTSYDVEALDPAQKDRFHIIVDIPYKPNATYFSKKYSLAGEGAVEWWNKLSKDAKELVSPRRLEYAIKVHQAGGSLRHVLQGPGINIQSLAQMMAAGSIKKRLRELSKADAAERATAFADINFTTNAAKEVLSNKGYTKAFAEYLPKEMLADAIGKADATAELIAASVPDAIIDPILGDVMQTLPKNQQKRFGQKFGDRESVSQHLPAKPVKVNTGGSLDQAIQAAFVNVTHVTQNSTYVRKKAINTIADMVLDERRNGNFISMEDAVRLTMLMAAIISRSQAATTASATANGNGVWVSQHAMGGDIDAIDVQIAISAVDGGYTLDQVRDMAKADLMRKPGQRMFLHGRTGPAWNKSQFKKVEDRFTWFV